MAGRALPDACLARLRTADAIRHAGDLIELCVLEQMRALGPPACPSGNVEAYRPTRQTYI